MDALPSPRTMSFRWCHTLQNKNNNFTLSSLATFFISWLDLDVLCQPHFRLRLSFVYVFHVIDSILLFHRALHALMYFFPLLSTCIYAKSSKLPGNKELWLLHGGHWFLSTCLCCVPCVCLCCVPCLQKHTSRLDLTDFIPTVTGYHSR
jgi:hypothetical protein